jgi:regulatory protein
MAVITDIKPLQKDAHRCAVFVDNDYVFSVSEDGLARLNLRRGQSVEDERLREVVAEAAFEDAKNRAVRSLSRRARCESDIRRLLRNCDAVVINRVIAYLKAHNWLNDDDYARQFAAERLRLKPRSLRMIGLELKHKGIAAKQVDDVIAGLKNQADELEIALKLAQKKQRQYVRLEPDKQKRRMYDLLRRHGFSNEIACAVLKQLGHPEIAETNDEDSAAHPFPVDQHRFDRQL